LAKADATHGQNLSACEWLSSAVLRGLNQPDRARAHMLKAHCAMSAGEFAEAETCLDAREAQAGGLNNLRLLRLNLARLRASAQNDDTDGDQLELLNAGYREMGILQLGKREQAAPLELANLTGMDYEVGSANSAGKVTVVMPCFNAEATIVWALRSVLEQTYGDHEVLCIDDASTDSTRELIRQFAADGWPVKLLENDLNSGPYFSRNRGLEHAQGSFLTVHDADDWMHPQRLELQVRHLLQSKNVSFSFTRLIRVTSDFTVSLRPFRPMLEPIHWSYTSILGRVEDFCRLGGWDPVLAHADAEFIDRAKEQLGVAALEECHSDVPLALFLDGETNLTRASATGLMSVECGARKEYQEQARFWRSQHLEQLQQSGLLTRPHGRRPFYVPNALLPARMKRDTDYDFVFVTDMSLLGGTRRCNLEYFAVCKEMGWRVGVFNYPRYRGRGVGTIDIEYRKLFDSGDVELLTHEDSVNAKCVIVHHPPILAAPLDHWPDIQASRVGILVNQLPYQTTDGSADSLYETQLVEKEIIARLDRDPIWIPISGLVRARLGRFVSDDRMSVYDWYPVISGQANSEAAPDSAIERTGDKIVVGRHSRDDATKWPESERLLTIVFPTARDIEVKILGGARTICIGEGARPSNWTVHPFDSISVDDYLGTLDVFIHWTRSDYIEEFGRNVAEAMAFGVPCILSPDLESTFGDAALYPEPEEVEATVRRIVQDAELRNRLVTSGKRFVQEYCSRAVAADRMRNLLEIDTNAETETTV
jgi:glycosyltransferase involved in cell wall biosynthesis